MHSIMWTTLDSLVQRFISAVTSVSGSPTIRAQPDNASESADDRALRDLLEKLQSENLCLKKKEAGRISSPVASRSELEDLRLTNRILESVMADVWTLFEAEKSLDDDYVNSKALAEYRTQFRKLLDDPDYRSRTDAGNIVNVTMIRRKTKTRPPSSANALRMWADERRKRECAEERLADAQEFIQFRLTNGEVAQ